jgi:hypothetical protein
VEASAKLLSSGVAWLKNNIRRRVFVDVPFSIQRSLINRG